MSAKTIFLVIISVLVTIILMKNTDEVDFWLFGDRSVPKLAVLGVMFLSGAIVGFILGRPRRRSTTDDHFPEDLTKKTLSQEDRDYISDDDSDYIR
ncbi:hypothetical protein GZH53_07205 [Flavihumibacter sp. R14]|nr:hypothetical protein [Flavihumibacter soli]